MGAVRRAMVRVFVCAAVGVAATYGAGIGAAILGHHSPVAMMEASGPDGAYWVRSFSLWAATARGYLTSRQADDIRLEANRVQQLLAQLSFTEPTDAFFVRFEGERQCWWTIRVAGAPWPTLRGWEVEIVDRQFNPIEAASGGLVTLASAPIPLNPIWRGFLASTLLCGAVAWLLWLAPSVTRRALRRRRGACPRCGYDLRGGGQGVCPECGGGA
jgi:hypothetical protein